MKPLVYVRDCNSLSGTFVDDHNSPPKRVPPSSGYLLSQGEVIRLPPYWEFHVYLPGLQRTDSPISQLRPGEIELFRDRFLVTGQVLGSGAFATVHLAVDLRKGKQVACKIHRLNHPRRGSSGTVRRILGETNILSRLTHPNLLKFVAAFRSSDTLYTFTELATGGDLFSMRLKYLDGLQETDIKLIMRQIVDAVCYLHQQNIAHRDLKPENVFFATGPTPMARVIVGDLGFAKVATSGRMRSKIGTERFIAPEIYHGQCYGAEVDIWSVGMISLFLTALPWGDIGLFEAFDQDAVDKALTAAFYDLSKRDKALSSDFKDFIQACLSVEPSMRMTADISKRHSWFGSSWSRLKGQIRECTKDWKPTQVVHNSVEDLDLLESRKLQKTITTISPNKRTTQDDSSIVEDTQYSHYFTKDDPTGYKRQKISQANLVVKVTGLDEEMYHLGI
ncbi:kinase-like domain-containing protein [Xylaria digitata]|nr:kinase-like domain-containing protein [Xylaria digitata]